MRVSLKSLVRNVEGMTPDIVVPALQEQPAPAPNYRTAQTRRNTRQIAGHFHADVAQALRLLAAEQDKDNQELLAEALTMLFQRYGKPIIVEVPGGRRKRN